MTVHNVGVLWADRIAHVTMDEVGARLKTFEMQRLVCSISDGSWLLLKDRTWNAGMEYSMVE